MAQGGVHIKQKLIFVGNMQKETIHLVATSTICKQYHKVKGQIVEYENIHRYEEIAEREEELQSALLCMDGLEEVEQEVEKESGRAIIYIPELKEWDLDTLLLLVQRAKDTMMQTPCVGIAGKGDSLGRMMMDMLRKFKIMQNMSGYHLLLGLPEEAGMEELANIEDILKEYIIEGSSLYIEQVLFENTKEYHYFLYYKKFSEVK